MSASHKACYCVITVYLLPTRRHSECDLLRKACANVRFKQHVENTISPSPGLTFNAASRNLSINTSLKPTLHCWNLNWTLDLGDDDHANSHWGLLCFFSYMSWATKKTEWEDLTVVEKCKHRSRTTPSSFPKSLILKNNSLSVLVFSFLFKKSLIYNHTRWHQWPISEQIKVPKENMERTCQETCPPITNDPIGTSSLLQPTLGFKMKELFKLCT